MTADRCPTCGQHVGHGALAPLRGGSSDEVELEILTLDSLTPRDGNRPAGSGSPDSAGAATPSPVRGLFKNRPVLGLFLAAAAVFALLQVLDAVGNRRSGPSNVLEEAGPELVERPVGEDAVAPSTSTEVGATADESATAVETSPEDSLQDAIANGLPGLGPYVVSYRTADGLVALSDTTAFPSDPKLLALYNEVEGFAFLVSDEGTWAINPADPSDSFLVSYSSEVVATRTGGRHVFIDSLENGQRVAGVIINGVTGPYHEIPRGSKHLLVPDLGVLIMPPTGGTVLLESTTINAFSDDHVVAATANAWVAQRCDEALVCSMSLVDAGSGEEFEVPDVSADRPPLLSPDGTKLLISTDDSNALISVPATGERVAVDGEVDPNAVWSPDSEFVAWIDGDDLVAIDAASGLRTRAQLPIQPIAPALLVTLDPKS